MDFRPLGEVERKKLAEALRGNVDSNVALLMDPKDTRFLGTTETEEEDKEQVTDQEVINAIRSVPCHY